MTSLYVDRRGIDLELDGGALVFRENGERVGTVPIAPLTRVFLRGDIRLSAALLGHLGEAGVGVVVLSGRLGRPSLLLARPHNDAARRIGQWEASREPAFCLKVAGGLVAAKLDRQGALLEEYRERRLDARYELTRALRGLDSAVSGLPERADLASLRGAEGAAARSYFQGLAAVAPAGLHFTGRNRRPPKDPLNAVLSLTYTLLHAEATIALYGAGFDSYVGFFHALDFGRESLASDLIEPVRPLADRFALRLFEQGELRAEDFSQTDAGCLLGKAGRARYYAAFEGAAETLRHALTEEVDRLAEQLAERRPASGLREVACDIF
jgi:CRISPR-associated protein Cas1